MLPTTTGTATRFGTARMRDLRACWWVKGARVAPVHDRHEITGAAGDVVTLVPLGGPAEGVTTTGLRWPLDGETLPPGSTRGVSNEMTRDTATVSVASGVLLSIHVEEAT